MAKNESVMRFQYKLNAIQSCYTQLENLIFNHQSLIDIDKDKMNRIYNNLDSALIYLSHALDSLENLLE